MHLPDRETLTLIGVVVLAGLLVLGALRLATTRQERHRRKAERDRKRFRHARLPQGEAQFVTAFKDTAEVWRTGEFEAVPYTQAFDEPPPMPLHAPRERSSYARREFERDPLHSPMLPNTLDEPTGFFRTIESRTFAGHLSEPVAADLERTGAWYAADIRRLLEQFEEAR